MESPKSPADQKKELTKAKGDHEDAIAHDSSSVLAYKTAVESELMIEEMDNIERTLGSSDVDNSKSLKIFFDSPGLYDCYKRKQDSTEHLKDKVVLLFITDLDPDLTRGVENAILQQLYLEKWHNQLRKESMHEVVWVPVLMDRNWTTEKIDLFKNQRKKMEWHSVNDASKVDPTITRFIIERWNFAEKPFLVAMDTEGKIVHKNAIPMICTWGSMAYPFTATREKQLWENTSWSVDFVLDDIDQNMQNWMEEGKHICVYGGDKLEWVRDFTNAAKTIAGENGFSLEMVYVGKSKLKKELANTINIIRKEGLSRTLDWNINWYFWVRLENMLYSKQQTVDSENIENDPIIQKIVELLSYDLKQQNWAMITSGLGDNMVMANGRHIIKGLTVELKKRKKRKRSTLSFVTDLDAYIRNVVSTDSTSFVMRLTAADQSGKDNELALEAVGRILESVHNHNSRSLNVLFHFEYGQKALYDCYGKKRVSTDDLRWKVVVIFITDLDPKLLQGREFSILQKMYLQEQPDLKLRVKSKYEVVWLPVVDFWNEQKYEPFKSLRDHMHWFSVHHPLVVSPAFITYIKEKWNFVQTSMLVVMDTQGKIEHHNPIDMMSIWGNRAFPFTADREKELWEKTIWSIEFLIDKLEPNMDTWLREERHICLYGGEDMKWIQDFTSIAKNVVRESGITLELLYVGRPELDKGLARNIVENIQSNDLSRTLDQNQIWHFWMRIETMRHSKGRLINETNRENIENEPIMQGVTAMLSYGSTNQGWAVIGRVLEPHMVEGNGYEMFKLFVEHDRWKLRASQIGFVPAMVEYIHKIRTPEPMPVTEEKEDESCFFDFEYPRPIYVELIRRYVPAIPTDDILNKRKITFEEVFALFITEINPELIHTPEYAILQVLHFEKRQNLTSSESSQYEVIWVPVTDIWTEENYSWFENLRKLMEWDSVPHTSVESPVVQEFIREKWNFSKKPIVVVMDTHGRIVHNNAIPMMCIWGSQAYPFTIIREKLLWEETSWTIDLMVPNFLPDLINWLAEGRCICLYGGNDDIKWIRKFVRIAKEVARDSEIILELIHVGKIITNEGITNSIIDLINRENLSRSFNLKWIWYFWFRLEIMLYSKRQFTAAENVDNDTIIQGIIAMLTYGSSNQGFAVISHGYSKMVMDNGQHMLKALAEHGRWKAREADIGFVPALDEYLRLLNEGQ